MNNATIGERAVEAIENSARENGRTIGEELILLGACFKTKGDWQYRGRNPQAYYLQQMALQGYDIYYILTGETKHEN